MTKETVVQAEVLEDNNLDVDLAPASITANFAVLDAQVEQMIELYKGATYDLTDASAIKQAKRNRTYLNGIVKQIDERRKAVKREYMKPLEAFEAEANAITAKVKQVANEIKVQLDEAEENRKNELFATLQEHYETYAELLVPVVPYSRIHEDSWLNKSFGEKKACGAIEAKVDTIAKDWEALKSQSDMPHYDLAERTFFETLDLGVAFRAASEAAEADARIAELHVAVDSPTFDEAPEEAPDYEPVEETFVEEPETLPEPVPEPVPAPAPAPLADAVEVSPYVMIIDAATLQQINMIGKFCSTLNPPVTGKFCKGTLFDVCRREVLLQRGY